MTPPIDRNEKKVQIARAAIGVFAEKGVDGARMAEVARAAEVGKGTIYEYFSSKDDLFEFAVNHFFEALNRDLSEKLGDVEDPVRQLETFVRTMFDSMRTAGSELHIVFEMWAEGVRTGQEYFDLRAMYKDYRKLIGDMISRGIENGAFRPVEPESTAGVIIGALDGMMLQWILFEDAFDLENAPDVFLDLVMGGLIREGNR